MRIGSKHIRAVSSVFTSFVSAQTESTFERDIRFAKQTKALRSFTFVLLCALVLVPFTAGHAQSWAKTRLEGSPRHREHVAIASNGHALQALVVYPEIKTKAPVVILIHEIFGLSDWAKEIADEIAGAGYIVIAPDLVTGLGPNGGNTDAFDSQAAVVKAVATLNADAVTADLDAIADYGRKLPASNGKLNVVGFSWGAVKSFGLATHRRDLSAAFVFYGPGPADVNGITAPVYGFYAGNDARVGATIPATTEAMKAAGKTYEPVTYEGAGNGFMRSGEDPAGTPENKKARDESFARLIRLLKEANEASATSTQSPDSAQQLSTVSLSQKLMLDQQNAAFFQTQLQSAQAQACYGNGTTAAVCNGLKAANIGRLQAALDQANAQVSQDQLAVNIQPDSGASLPQSGGSDRSYSTPGLTASTQSKSEYVPGLPQCTRTLYTSADASLYIVNSCSVAVTVGFTSDSGNTWGQGDVGPNSKSEATAFGIDYDPKRDGKVYLFTCPKGMQPVMPNGNAFLPHDYKGQYTCHR